MLMALPSPARTRSLNLRSQLTSVCTYGTQSLSDAELVAELLAPLRHASSHQVAVQLLEHCGGLTRLSEHGVRGLMCVAGINALRARRILVALELGRRACRAREPAPLLTSHEDVYDWSRARLCYLAHEEVWLLCVDGRNRLRTAERVGQGGVHGCGLTPADLLRPAVRTAASAAILVHNHPSGDPTPSEQDLQMTRAVAKAFELVGIPLLDHVVVARSHSASVAAFGVTQTAGLGCITPADSSCP